MPDNKQTAAAPASGAQVPAPPAAETAKPPKVDVPKDHVLVTLSGERVWEIPGGGGKVRYPKGEVAVHKSFAEHLTVTESRDAPKK